MVFRSLFLLLLSDLFLRHGFAQVVSPLVVPPEPSASTDQIPVKDTEATLSCDDACAKLASLLPERLFRARSGDFAMWDAQQAELTPACRVEPKSAEDVSTILKTVVKAGCHFAIKSGGHSRAVGASNADGGVTIDLVRMDDVRIQPGKKTVKVGAGARWKQVYDAVEKEGLMVIGGRVADVGVGGLLLSGGISFFSNRYGWACDSVTAYELVLPDGTITTVTHKSHPELFFALRGAGSSNFGIVTTFTLEAFSPFNPAGLWDMTKTYSWDKVPELLELHHKHYTADLDLDFDTGGFFVFSYFAPYDSYFPSVRLVHTTHDTTETWPKVFEAYKEIEGLPNATTLDIWSFSDITEAISKMSPYGGRNIYGTMTFRPSVELHRRIIEIFQEEFEKIKVVEGMQPNVVFHPFSRRAISQMSKNGGNAMGLQEKDGPLVILNYAGKWDHEKDDAVFYGAYYNFINRSEAAAKEMGLWHRFKYINYAEATQDVWSGYGPENLKRLKQIQSKVDPNRIFTQGGLGGGYFKLNGKDEALEVPMHNGKSEL